MSFPLVGSLRLVRNPSDLFGIEERFQTSWNDKIKKDSGQARMTEIRNF